jgi:hypothetical protein
MEEEIKENLIDILDRESFENLYNSFYDEKVLIDKIKNKLTQTRFNLVIKDVKIQRVNEFEFQIFLKTNIQNFIFNIDLDEL